MKLDEIVPENFIEEAIVDDLKSGKSKEVITRCPPEPSGHWHIGHVKAWTIDFETAIKFGGYTNLRMDDTNPTKEDGDFAESYVEDLKWLGYTPKNVIYSSEAYFEKMYEVACDFIKRGLAYVCELSGEEVSKTRGTLTEPGINSPYRNRPIAENLKMFADMRAGKYADGSVTLRAKIDMAHPNMNMRDPVMYRVMRAHHYKVGDTWCIYPMYDFAHPLEDAFEGITYSLCDLTFEDHRPLYNWFVENAFPGRKYLPRQIEFSKLAIENVLLGKRYLKQIVNSGRVMGWDDPRFFTIAGMRRRGIPAEAVKNFVKSLGVTKIDSLIPKPQFDYFVRDELNKAATRAMVVLDPLKVKITNLKADEEIFVENNPNVENGEKHKSVFSNVIYIEREDFSSNPPPKYNRLVLGGMVRLKNAYIIKCNNVVYKNNGEIDYLECEYLPETRSGSDNSGIKVKGTIHFVAESNAVEVTIRNFKNLTKEEYLEPDKALGDGVSLDDLLEPNSMEETKALAEKFVLTAQVGDKFQFVRKGYFALDPDSTKTNLIFNNTVSLKDGYKLK